MSQIKRDSQHSEEDNQDDEHEHEEQEEPKSKRRKRVQVMTDSTQTDAQRRELRHNQRQLYKKLTDQSNNLAEKIADVESEAFDDIRAENNQLWGKVKYVREAVLDGDNVDVISTRAARQVDKLISVPRYDADRLASKLRSKCSIRNSSSTLTFDWKTFGVAIGSCFNAVPTYSSFLNGPIDVAYTPKERKKVERRKASQEDDAEEEEVGTVQQKTKSKDEDKLSAVEKQITSIQKTLKSRTDEHSGKVMTYFKEKVKPAVANMGKEEKKEIKRKMSNANGPCAVQFLFNPDSFTQTVENIFGLSFLVKKGTAQIGVRTANDCVVDGIGAVPSTAPGPYVRMKSKKENDGGGPPPPARQAIVSFNMQDWRAMKEAYLVEKGDIPHRAKSKHAKNAAK